MEFFLQVIVFAGVPFLKNRGNKNSQANKTNRIAGFDICVGVCNTASASSLL